MSMKLLTIVHGTENLKRNGLMVEDNNKCEDWDETDKSIYIIAYHEGKKKGIESAIKILNEWWEDEFTCSGLPSCSIAECDLCMNCFKRLMKKLNDEKNENKKV